MKNKAYYLNLPYQMLVKKDGDEFVAFYKEYPKITGAGDNEIEAINELKEAFECLIDDCLLRGEVIKEPSEAKERVNVLLSKSTLAKIKERTKNRSLFLDLSAKFVLENNIKLANLA